MVRLTAPALRQEFGLPDGQSLNLPVCACILMKGKDAEGADAIRPYTPISDNSMLGKFQLLIKRYEQGVVSSYVHGLEVGAEVEFKHIPCGPLQPPRTLAVSPR